MKRLLSLLCLAGLLTTLSAGCYVGRHGHVAFVPPPALLVAGALALAAARPGYVWVDGHWDWVDDDWAWRDGYWMADRPGFVWIQGSWYSDGGRHYYRPGRWSPRGGGHVRDHR